MSKISATSLRHSLAASPLLLMLACVCPPCEAPGALRPAAVVPVGSRLLIWNGDGGDIASGQGWADCDQKGKCVSKLGPVPKVGHNNTTGLDFHVKGQGWAGGGWNWFGWWPPTAGTDIRPYTNLTFWIRVVAKSPELGPEPGALSVALGCSNGKKSSASVMLAKYEKNVMDGQWHKMSIPLVDFYTGKEGSQFDPATAWEFRLSHWAGTPRDFDVIVDDLAVEKK